MADKTRTLFDNLPVSACDAWTGLVLATTEREIDARLMPAGIAVIAR